MSLNVGELSATLKLDMELSPGIARAQQQLRDKLNDAKHTAAKAGQDAGKALGDGLATTATTGARRGGKAAGDAAGDAVKAGAKRGGEQAGRALGDGLGQAVPAAKREGTRAGEAFGVSAGSAVKSAAKGVATAVGGLFVVDTVVDYVKGAIGAASDLNETVNKSGAIFGAQASAMSSWGDNAARALGMSKGAALDAAAGFGDMFTQLGFAGDQAAAMSRQVVQMSADLGSFSNLPTADVAERISAAFRGEYDSLQLLIPNISAARVEQQAMAMTGEKSASALTAQQKAAAVLAIVQQDGSRAMGDFARTSDQAANAAKIATATAQDQAAAVGQKLLPAWTALLNFTNSTVLPGMASMASGASDLATAFTRLPAPVQAIAAAFLTWKVAGSYIEGLGRTVSGPIVGGFQRLSTAVSMAGMASQVAGGGFTGAAAGLRAFTGQASLGAVAMGGLKAAGSSLLGFFGGPWGLAFMAAAAAIGFLVQKHQEAAQKAQEQKAYEQQLAGTLDETTGAITRATAQAQAKQAVDSGLVAGMEKLGYSSEQVGRAIAGEGDAYEQIVGQIDAAITAQEQLQNVYRASRDAQQAADAGRQIEQLRQLREQLVGQHDATAGAKTQWDQAKGALQGLSGATTDAKDKTGQLTKEHQAAAEAEKKQKEELKQLASEIDAYANQTTGAHKAQADWAAALEELPAKLKELSGATNSAHTGFDLMSKKGRDAQSFLDGFGTTARDAALKTMDLGHSEKYAAAEMDKARAQFVTAATKLGLTTEAANALADQLGITKDRVHAHSVELAKVPKAVSTKVGTPGLPDAVANTKEYLARLGLVPSRKATTFTANVSQAMGALRNLATAMSAVPGMAGYSVILRNATGGAATGGPIEGLRIGGPVRGPGTGTSDSVPAVGPHGTPYRLSNGEHVWTERETAAVGGHGAMMVLRDLAMRGLLKVRQARRIATAIGDVRALAGGGPVTPVSMPGSGPSAASSPLAPRVTLGKGSAGKITVHPDGTVTATPVVVPVALKPFGGLDDSAIKMLSGDLIAQLIGFDPDPLPEEVARVEAGFASFTDMLQRTVLDREQVAEKIAQANDKVKEAERSYQDAEVEFQQARTDLARAQAAFPSAAADAAFREAEGKAKDAKNARNNARQELKEWRQAAAEAKAAQADYAKAVANLKAVEKKGASFERLARLRAGAEVARRTSVDAADQEARQKREYTAARKVADLAGQQERAARAKWESEQARVPSGGAASTGGGGAGYVMSGALKAAPKDQRAAFIAAGAKYGISPNVLAAVAYRESSFNPGNVTGRYKGIMQLSPEETKGINWRNAAQNIERGAQILAGYAKKYNGNMADVLAAHNAGIGNVKKYGGGANVPFTETRNYIRRITSDAGVVASGHAKNIKAVSNTTAAAMKVTRQATSATMSQQEKLIAYGKELRRLGFDVGENRALGDNPRRGVHAAGGWHYKNNNSGAVDVNANRMKGGEKLNLDKAAAVANALGLRTIWQTKGHYDHLHVDASTGASMGSRGKGSIAGFSLPMPGKTPTATTGSLVPLFGGKARKVPTAHIKPGTLAVGRAVADMFGSSILEIGGWRSGGRYGDHPSGEAFDFMMSKIGNKATGKGLQAGNILAEYLVKNAKALGTKNVIWQGRIWSAAKDKKFKPLSEWRTYQGYGGSKAQNVTTGHFDHVHWRGVGGKGGIPGLDLAGLPSAAGVTSAGGTYSPPGYQQTATGEAKDVPDPKRAADQEKTAKDRRDKAKADLDKARADKAMAEAERVANEQRAKIVADLVKQAEPVKKHLQALAVEEKKLKADLESATKAYEDLVKQQEDYARQVANSAAARGALDKLFNVGEDGNITAMSAVLSDMGKAADKAEELDGLLQQLKARGLDDGLLQQVAGMDMEKALRFAREAIESNSISELNSTYARLQTVTKKLGDDTAESLYGAGVTAAKGVMDGLKAEHDAMVEVMQQVAAAFILPIIQTLQSLGANIPADLAGLAKLAAGPKGDKAIADAAAAGAAAVTPKTPALQPVQVTVKAPEVRWPERMILTTERGSFEAVVTAVADDRIDAAVTTARHQGRQMAGTGR